MSKKIERAQASGHISSGETPFRGSSGAPSRTMDPERRHRIISEALFVLERCSSCVEKESHLPFSKPLIRQAICEELTENPDSESRDQLEMAFVQLESFLPEKDYLVIQGFQLTNTLAQEMAKSGAPEQILASARILRQAEGKRALEIQERISGDMTRRLQQVRVLGKSDSPGGSLLLSAQTLPLPSERKADSARLASTT